VKIFSSDYEGNIPRFCVILWGQGGDKNMDQILQAIRELQEQMTRFESNVNTRFERLETRMDRIETRMDGLETRMDRIETRMDGLETRMDKLENRMDKLESRMTVLEENQQDTQDNITILVKENWDHKKDLHKVKRRVGMEQ
jgi:chromosome segregation ATPase